MAWFKHMNFRRHLARANLQELLAKRKATKRRGRPKAMRRPVPPKAIERKYQKALTPYLAKMHSLTKTLLLPRLAQLEAHAKAIRGDEYNPDEPRDKKGQWAGKDQVESELATPGDRVDAIITGNKERRNDGPLEDATAIFERMRAELEQSWGDQDLASIANDIAGDTMRYAQEQLRNQLGDALGESPFLAVTPGMDLAAKGFAKDNVRLIQGLSDTYYDQLETMVNDTVRSGSSTADLAAQIEDRFDITTNRAAFIARDQVSKLNGDIAEAQQTDLGITHYTWRTSLDDRVRPDHASKEGKVFAWDDPPEDTGHPGEDYSCRCTAEPIIPEADNNG